MNNSIVQFTGYILFILSTFIKLIFFYRIKSRKEKKFASFIKSFRTWYLNHNFHDADNNPSRMFFMKSSNIINIFWWLGLAISILFSVRQFIAMAG